MADPTFKVNGKEYPIATDLTLGEMCDAERYFGVEFGEGASTGVRMAAALLWISITRVDDAVTVDDVRALPPDVFEAFNEVQEAEESPPPDAAEDELSAPSGGSSPNGGADPDNVPPAIGPEPSAIHAA